MKKILVTLFIVFVFVQSAFASNWYEINKKLYVDLDSCNTIERRYLNEYSSYREKRYRFIVKALNTGNWEKEKGQQIWYKLVEWETDGKRIKINRANSYNKQGNLVNAYKFDDDEDYDYPMPDSTSEDMIKVFKILYNKGYFY